MVLAVTSKDSKHADACVQMIICDINKFSPDTYSFRCRSDLVSDFSQNFIETLRMIFFLILSFLTGKYVIKIEPQVY